MAASSQGDEEDEERRALELELAAELAALSAHDVGFVDSSNENVDQNDDIVDCAGRNGEIEMDYVRLDLGNVLKQMAKGSADEVQDLLSSSNNEVPPTSWELLLQSVERSDRDFLQPCHENIHEIRTFILETQPSSLSTEQPIQQVSGNPEKQLCQFEVEVGRTSPKLSTSQSEQTELPESVNEKGNSLDKVEKCKKSSNHVEDETISIGNSITDASEVAQVDNIPQPPDLTAQILSDAQLLTIISKENQPEDDQDIQEKLQAIAKQHEARELRRLKTQARYEKERDEAARLLLNLQEEFEAQEKHAEITRREAQERSLMTKEEMFCRQCVAAEREAQEIVFMTLADENSRNFAFELVRIQNVISKEIAQMEAEDQAQRHRMQVERMAQYQKQKALARCQFGAVLLDLVKYHEVQRQIRDQQTKRERRECVEMRAEEAYMQRIIVETRVLREQRKREANRALMMNEDKLAGAIEAQERRQKLQAQEEYYRRCIEDEERRTRSAWAFLENLQLIQRQNEDCSRAAMAFEEKRCRCVWKYFAEQAEAKERECEVQRLQVLSKVSTGFHKLNRIFGQHRLVKYLEKWKLWYTQCVENDRIRSASADHAAKRIQMWHRSCRQKLQQLDSIEPPLILENFSDDETQPQLEENTDLYVDSTENQEAALRLQSTFRGFHVRRKFANALALAQAVKEHDEGDSFDAVDLDGLIQLPPELVDGWEDPVLPPTSVLAQRQYPQVYRDEKRCERVDNNAEDMQNDRSFEGVKAVVKVNVLSTPMTNTPPKEQNLAATLWNKMKRMKQRQQNSQLERQRQQDPTYRVQKLLNRKPNNRNSSNQNGNTGSQSSHTQGAQKVTNLVSWASSGNAKKKPKVKLPSLVERLRKQTMAER